MCSADLLKKVDSMRQLIIIPVLVIMGFALACTTRNQNAANTNANSPLANTNTNISIAASANTSPNTAPSPESTGSEKTALRSEQVASVASQSSLPNGTLIRKQSNAGGGAVYVIVNGARHHIHHIANLETFFALGFKAQYIRVLPDNEVEGIPEQSRINSPSDYRRLMGISEPNSIPPSLSFSRCTNSNQCNDGCCCVDPVDSTKAYCKSNPNHSGCIYICGGGAHQ
jgi:hypothetical protein